MTKKVLEVKDITKIYKVYKSSIDRLKEIFIKKIYHKEFIANNNISFELFEGETLGIVGINGAGKSTILKMIAGVVTPTSGEIMRRGRITALLELGTGFNSEMNGYDNIYLNGTLIGMGKDEIDSKVKDIINFSELGDFIYEPIKAYSSGMKMRLAFSIAIFSEPKTLIVDEALSVGDAHFQAKCTRALTQRKEKNMSIIYVSHDLNSIKVLCDRAILLDKGKIVEIGNPEQVINSYNFLITKLNDLKNRLKIDDVKDDSFGTFDIEIINVEVKGEDSKSNIISSGENATLSVEIYSKIKITNMTIGIMFRDKFGQDIFGTNTSYYHDLNISFEANKKYLALFKMPLNIGNGKYNISIEIHSEETHLDYCPHWLDNAASFEIAGNYKNTFFGICKLEPSIEFQELRTDNA
jgi:lipopolysaccharide transport system ATP-binding protein